MTMGDRIGWFLASWFPGRWIRLGSSGYRCDWGDVVRRGRFKDGV